METEAFCESAGGNLNEVESTTTPLCPSPVANRMRFWQDQAGRLISQEGDRKAALNSKTSSCLPATPNREGNWTDPSLAVNTDLWKWSGQGGQRFPLNLGSIFSDLPPSCPDSFGSCAKPQAHYWDCPWQGAIPTVPPRNPRMWELISSSRE